MAMTNGILTDQAVAVLAAAKVFGEAAAAYAKECERNRAKYAESVELVKDEALLEAIRRVNMAGANLENHARKLYDGADSRFASPPVIVEKPQADEQDDEAERYADDLAPMTAQERREERANRRYKEEREGVHQ